MAAVPSQTACSRRGPLALGDAFSPAMEPHRARRRVPPPTSHRTPHPPPCRLQVLLISGTARLAGLAFPATAPSSAPVPAAPGPGEPAGDREAPLRRGEAEWLYMAPELMRPARAAERGPPADTFAWAMLAAHLCTGAPPWAAAADQPARGVGAAGRVPSRAELLRLVAVRRARPALSEAAPARLRAAIERSWVDDPAARPRPADMLPWLLEDLP